MGYKKYLLLILTGLLIMISVDTCAQTTYPQTQSFGNANTKGLFNGGLQVMGVFILGNFADTVAANAVSYVKNYPSGLITTGTSLATQKIWMRNYIASGWIQIHTSLSPATWQQTLNAGRTGDSAYIDNGAAGESYVIRNRNIALGFPVATIQPVTAAKNMAVNFSPRFGAVDFAGNGLSWLHVTDSDVSSGAGNTNTAVLGISTTYAEVGVRNFGGTNKPFRIVVNADTRMNFLASANQADFTIGKINQVQSISGDYVGYSMFNTNNTVAESNPIFFIGQDLGSSRFGYIRWNNNATPLGSQGYRIPNQLEIISNVGATGGLVLGSLSINSKIDLVTSVDGVTNLLRARLDSAGNFGINTATPTTKLHVSGANGFRYVDGNEGTGKVLVSDVNGIGSWQAGATGSGVTNQMTYWTSSSAIGGTTSMTVNPSTSVPSFDFKSTLGSSLRFGDAGGTFSVIEFNSSTYNMVFGLAGYGTGTPVLYLKQATNNAGMGGVTNPTARLHLGGGTATAGQASFKINSGTLLGTPEDGAMEYASSHLNFTIGSNRYQLDQTGTTNYVAKWSSGTVLGNSVIFDNGTNVGIGTTTPETFLQIGPTLSSSQATFKGYLQITGGTADNALNGLEFFSDGAASGYGWRQATIFDGIDGYSFILQSRKNSSSWASRLVAKTTGQFQLTGYGSLAFPGTPTSSAYFDANGNIIEGSIPTSSQWTTDGSSIYYNNPVGIGNGKPTSDYLVQMDGTTTADNSRVLNITQADDALESTYGINLTNTVSPGSVGNTTITVRNIQASLTPTVSLSPTLSRTYTQYGIDHNSSLSNITVPDPTTGNLVMDIFGVSNNLSGSPTLADNNATGSATLNAYGLKTNTSITPTYSGTENWAMDVFGSHVISNLAPSSTANLLSANVYGVYVLPQGNLGTAGITAHYGIHIADGAGTAVDNYGLYIAGVTGATNNYSIYNAGTSPIHSFGKSTYDATITAGGTTGDRTINKPSGTVNIAATGTTVTVTNSFCTTSSIVYAVIRTNDATAAIRNVVPGSGSFVITLTAAATAEISIGFIVFN